MALFKMKAIPDGFIPGSFVSVRGRVLNPEVDSFIVDIQETSVSLNKGVIAMHFRPHFKGNYTELRFLKDGVWNTEAEDQMPLLIKPDASEEFTISIYSTRDAMKVKANNAKPFKLPHNLVNLEKIKVLGVYGDLNEEIQIHVGFEQVGRSEDESEEASPSGGGMDKSCQEVPEVPKIHGVHEVPTEVPNGDEDTKTPPAPPSEPVEPSLDAAPVPEPEAPSTPLESPEAPKIEDKEDAALGPVENIDL